MTANVPPDETTPDAKPSRPAGILSGRYLWTTVGAFALVFLGAFESLAVTTIMPTVSAELNGEALYSLAFSGTLAASVVGMVVAGGWADRRGPSRPLVAAILIFLVGLVLSGTATDMLVFITGRLLQGLGSGAINVCLYVVVARIYPAVLHPRIFGTFAAAWVLPSLIGPPVAGVVAEQISWHWVFLGVGVLVVAASATIVPALRALWLAPVLESTAAPAARNILWSVVVAIGVLAISVSGESSGALVWIIAAVALVVVIVAIRPLVPRGTLTARRGLPSTVLLRGAVASAFFGTEVYLPYFLSERYDLPLWASGLILTVGAVSWATGSQVQGWLGERMSHDQAARLGATVLSIGITVQFVTALFTLSPFVAAAGWFLAGGGMGLIFPRIGTLVLAYSTERDQGFNSAAMSIADSAGGATSIAFAGLLLAAATGLGGGIFSTDGFAAPLALTAVLAILAIPVAFRILPERRLRLR